MAKREAVKQKIRATEAQVSKFASDLEGFVSRNLKKLLSDIEAGKIEAKEAARLLGRLFTELEKAGLKKEIAKAKTIFREELSAVKDTFQTLGARVTYSDTDRVIVETLVQGNADSVSAKVEAYTSTIRQAAMQQVLTGQAFDFEALHGKLGSRMAANIETEVNTSVQGFSRTVTLKKAKDAGFELMEYLGPDDQITREFCEKALAGKAPGVKPRAAAIYTLDEIQRMDNGQGLPVAQYCGGYNCRHQWRPISAEDAEAEGYKG